MSNDPYIAPALIRWETSQRESNSVCAWYRERYDGPAVYVGLSTAAESAGDDDIVEAVRDGFAVRDVAVQRLVPGRDVSVIWYDYDPTPYCGCGNSKAACDALNALARCFK